TVHQQPPPAPGLPLVPGSPGPVGSVDEVIALGKKIGFPVLIKAVAGGGGRGMKVVDNAEAASEAFSLARTEAKAAFSNDAVYLEKYLGRPRHIEIQVLGDGLGAGRHLREARLSPAPACISASATARCSGAIRRCLRKPPRPRSIPSSARRSASSRPQRYAS